MASGLKGMARTRSTSSILDWITGRVAELKRELGASDRVRMEQYLENIREIERLNTAK